MHSLSANIYSIKSFLTWVVITIVISCNNGNNSVPKDDVQPDESASSQISKQQLITGLKKIGSAFTLKDKNQIQAILSFPLADTTAAIGSEDPAFNREKEKNNGLITKEMFLKYFDKLSPALLLDDLGAMFKYLNIDSLAFKDTLEHEVRTKTDPCYYYYHIDIDKDILTLQCGTNSNVDYENKSSDADDEDDECIEWATIWQFRFDGKNLIFIRQALAG